MRRALLGMTVATAVFTLGPVAATPPLPHAATAPLAAPALAAALDGVAADIGSRTRQVTEDSWVRLAQANVDAARSLLATSDEHADPLEQGVAVAARATELQAQALGTPTLIPAPLARHAAPSAAAMSIAARYAVVPDARQLAALRGLDALPDATRDALTRVMDAFLSFDATTRTALAAGIVGRDAGVLHARRDLLLAAAALQRVLRMAEAATAVTAVTLCPALAIDVARVDSPYIDNCALVVDAGGDDRYWNNGGGASSIWTCGQDVPAAALIDVSGNDRYAGDGCGVNGGGYSGAGFLFDGAGDDAYAPQEGSSMAEGSNGGSTWGAGFLLDIGGHDTVTAIGSGSNGGAWGGTGLLVGIGGDDYYGGSGVSNGGAVESGHGMLVDTGGADTYFATSNFATNGGAAAGVGLLLDGDGDDSHVGANGGIATTFSGITGGVGLDLDVAGHDGYYDAASGGFLGYDTNDIQKGTVGAQVDLPFATSPINAVPPLPVGQATTFVSDGCDTGGVNVLTGHLAETYLKLRTRPDPSSPGTQWVCVAAEAAGTHVGSRIALGGVGVGGPAVDQDAASVAACGSNASNVRVQSGNVLGEPYWIDVTPQPAGSTDAAWVCVRFRNAVGVRLRYSGQVVPVVGATVLLDPSAPHVPAYPDAAWPAAGPSAACAAAVTGGTRYVDVVAGTTPVALYGWQETASRSHLCLRAGGAGGAGGRLTLDAAQGVAVSPVIRTAYDTTACPFEIFTRNEPPSVGLYTSTPGATPVSACAAVGGFQLGATLGGTGSSNPSWTPDPL